MQPVNNNNLADIKYIDITDNYEIEVPGKYTDAYSLDIMWLPVLASDGRNYDAMPLIQSIKSGSDGSMFNASYKLSLTAINFNYPLYQEMRVFFKQKLDQDHIRLQAPEFNEAREMMQKLADGLSGKDAMVQELMNECHALNITINGLAFNLKHINQVIVNRTTSQHSFGQVIRQYAPYLMAITRLAYDIPMFDDLLVNRNNQQHTLEPAAPLLASLAVNHEQNSSLLTNLLTQNTKAILTDGLTALVYLTLMHLRDERNNDSLQSEDHSSYCARMLITSILSFLIMSLLIIMSNSHTNNSNYNQCKNILLSITMLNMFNTLGLKPIDTTLSTIIYERFTSGLLNLLFSSPTNTTTQNRFSFWQQRLPPLRGDENLDEPEVDQQASLPGFIIRRS